MSACPGSQLTHAQEEDRKLTQLVEKHGALDHALLESKMKRSWGSLSSRITLLVKRGAKPRDVAYKLNDAIGRHFVHAEAEDGRRLPDDEPVKDGAVLRLVTGSAVTDPAVLEREKEREKERLRNAKAVSTTKTKAQRRAEQEAAGGGGDA